MYDLHVHLLPGLDDGPQTMESALVMARVAAQDGTRVIVATPHLRDVYERDAYREAQAKLQELQHLTAKEGLDLRFFMGMESLLEPDLPQRVKEGYAYTLGSSRFVLVELPLLLYPPYADETLFQLQLAGYTPILAHPERYAPMQRHPEMLQRLVERGMMAQITACSLLGSFGSEAKKAAEVFLQRNLAHIIASDAHSPQGHRAPTLSKGIAAAAKLVGAEKAHSMVEDIPAAILAGEKVTVDPPLPEPKRHFLGLW